MGLQSAAAEVFSGSLERTAEDPLGPVLFQSKTGIGEAVFLLGGGLCAIGVTLAPIWPASIWTWIMQGALVLVGVAMLLTSPVRLARAGTVCSFHEQGARRCRRNGWVEQELLYEDVEELTFQITRVYMNGVYSGTFQTLTIGSGRARERPYEVSRTFREDTGLVSDFRACHELEPLSQRIASLMAERMKAKIECGESVPWTRGLSIAADGLELPGRDSPPVSWDQIARVEIDKGIFRLWLNEERKARAEMPTSQPNFYPGYFLVYSLLQKSSEKERLAARRNPSDARSISVSYANDVDDFLAARRHERHTNTAKWLEWQARAWGVSGVVMIPGVAVAWLLWVLADFPAGLCLLIVACSQLAGLLLRPLSGRFAAWQERRNLAAELDAAHRWSAHYNCPDPFLQKQVTFSPNGYAIQSEAGVVQRSWGEVAPVECIAGYLFLTVLGGKLNRDHLELIVPERAFGEQEKVREAVETIIGWSR